MTNYNDEPATEARPIERSPIEIGLETLLRNSNILKNRLQGILRPSQEGANQDKPDEAPVIILINNIDEILEDILDRLVV